tara:strand:+ start:13153 stop:13875 length:723 start_codon:yes stop_codon:yes gene_type:complete
MDDVVVILQGIPHSEKQIIKDIKEYKKCGINNIILSSYSIFLNDEIRELCHVIENDKYGKIKNPYTSKKQIKPIPVSWNSDEVIEGLPTNNSSFWQITTTRRGIKLAKKLFPSARFYLKLRCDLFIFHLNKVIEYWKTINKKVPKPILERKIIVPGYNRYHFDYLTFGTKNDITNYYCGYKKVVSTWTAEIRMSNSYIQSIYPTAKPTDYLTVDSDIPYIWHKYNKKNCLNYHKKYKISI